MPVLMSCPICKVLIGKKNYLDHVEDCMRKEKLIRKKGKNEKGKKEQEKN